MRPKIHQLIVAILQTLAVCSFAQDIDTPRARRTAILLTDFVTDFEVVADGASAIVGFGGDVGAFERVAGGGVRGSYAGKLTTDSNGFTDVNAVIGFPITFAHPIDASEFSVVSYWLRDGDGGSNTATVAVELQLGNGSVWRQDPVADIGSEYVRIQVQLSASNFRRVAFGSGDGSFSLDQVPRINVLLLSGDAAPGTPRSIVVDEIILTAPPLQVAIDSRPQGAFVSVDGTPAQTPFTIDNVADGSSVLLSAPLTYFVSDEEFAFSYWDINSGRQLLSENPLDFEINHNSAATAVYRSLIHTVTVQAVSGSIPLTNVAVSGSHPGVTNYEIDVREGSSVRIVTPASVDAGGTVHKFARWQQDGVDLAARQRGIAFEVTGDATLTAVYGSGVLITVTSLPVNNVPITVDGATSSTDFTRFVGDPVDLLVNAPDPFVIGGQQLAFSKWRIESVGTVNDITANPATISVAADDVVVTAVFAPAITVGSRWNLVASPLEPDASAPISTLIPSEGRRAIWAWTGRRFESISASAFLEPHSGYWIYSDLSDLLFRPVGSIPSTPLGSLGPGWNLIGIGGVDAISDPGDLGNVGAIWWWSNNAQEYRSIDSNRLPIHRQNRFVPGTGYWIYRP